MKELKGYTNIKHWLIAELVKIGKSSKTSKQKDLAAKKAGEKARLALWIKVDNAKPNGGLDSFHNQESGEVSATTHNRYVTRLRRDIEESGIIDFSFNSEIERVKGLYPKQAKYLDNIDTATHSIIDSSIKSIIENVNKSIKRSKRESTIKSLMLFIEELKALKTSNSVFVALVRVGDEKANMSKREENRKVKYMKKQRKFSGLETMSLIYKLLKSSDWEDLTIGIALAVGRRCSEVVHFGVFTRASKNDTYALKFKGMRKSKVKRENIYKIPTLVEADLLLDAIDRLKNTERLITTRARLDSLKLHDAEYSRQLNSSLHAQLGTRINLLLNPDNSKGLHWVFKDTRALYARMAFAVYKANAAKAGREPMLDTAYFKSVLLHTDLNETLSYMQFQLTDEELFKAYAIKNARKDGVNLKFADRLPLLVDLSKTDVIASSRAYTKYINWCIEQLKLDNTITFKARLLRTGCGGKAATIGEFVTILEQHQLNAPNLIIVDSKKKKEKQKQVITKRVQVEVTLTYKKWVDIEYDEGEPESVVIESAVEDLIDYNLSIDEYDNYDHEVLDEEDMTDYLEDQE